MEVSSKFGVFHLGRHEGPWAAEMPDGVKAVFERAQRLYLKANTLQDVGLRSGPFWEKRLLLFLFCGVTLGTRFEKKVGQLKLVGVLGRNISNHRKSFFVGSV